MHRKGDMADQSRTDEERRQKLAELRRTAGLSQEALADCLGASRSSIYRWEAGEAVPQPRLLVGWAEAINISVDSLNDLLWSGDEQVRKVGDSDPPAKNEEGSEVPLRSEDPTRAAELVLPRQEATSLDDASAVSALLGLNLDEISRPEELQVAVALASFRGATSIDHKAARQDLGETAPPSFVQASDDVSNDYFFGKRDVLLANQITGALTANGFRVPIYVDDRSVWRQLAESDGQSGRPVIHHEGEPYHIDLLVVCGLWSNVIATALADWPAFPEFQMAGDPLQHSTRTIRFATPEGLRILDLNASDEADELGGNPAVIVSRRLAGLHLVIAGGATSLSTLRLAELLTKSKVWRDLAHQAFGSEGEENDGGGWVAVECPNAAKWKDRCRIVGSGTFSAPITAPIHDMANFT